MPPPDQSLQTFLGANWSQEARLEVEKRLRDKLGENYDPELLRCSWWLYKRQGQTTPAGDWRVWLILAGRGWGKTRTGAEFIREQVDSGTVSHIALVGPTAGDVRDTMIEGESGLLSIYPAHQRPRYEPSKRRVTFHNGAMATAFSADEPDRLRGPNHDLAWADELAAWRYPEAWDMLQLGLRIGAQPRTVVTTTPKPIPLVRRLIGTEDGTVHMTRGSTFDNRANLASAFLDEVISRYEGTRLGRQELYAEVLDDVEGALWSRDLLEEHRVTQLPNIARLVVAVDPAAGSKEHNAETGIVVVGLGDDGHGYVIDDVSLRGTPNDWGRAAVAAYHRHEADLIVAESNQGGDMVSHTLRTVDPAVPVKMVHASRGKRTRAEPVSALYEQGRVHHLGFHGELEDQLCSWVPDHAVSPDRLDALVWGVTEVLVRGLREVPAVVPVSMTAPSQWRL
jgi:phage terminase large subunit-like protein